MLKDNKGITLITLVITIIVLVILASVATFSGIGTIDYIKFNNAKAQFQTMQSHVNNWHQEYNRFCAKIDADNELSEEDKTTQKAEWLNNYGESISSAPNETTVANTLSEGTGSNDGTGYRYFKATHIKNDLDIDGISYDFLINISTRTVLIYGGIEYQDEMYYSAERFGINVVNYQEMSGNITFATEVKNKNIIVYNIQFPTDVNISKYNVEYKLSTKDTWTTLTLDKKRSYQYTDAEGNTIVDNNAWYIENVVQGKYNIQITTNSEYVNSEEIPPLKVTD